MNLYYFLILKLLCNQNPLPWDTNPPYFSLTLGEHHIQGFLRDVRNRHPVPKPRQPTINVSEMFRNTLLIKGCYVFQQVYKMCLAHQIARGGVINGDG